MSTHGTVHSVALSHLLSYHLLYNNDVNLFDKCHYNTAVTTSHYVTLRHTACHSVPSQGSNRDCSLSLQQYSRFTA